MATQEQEYVLLNPGEFAEGGGLIGDFDGEIADARFIMYDYNGKMDHAIPVAKIVFNNLEGDEVGQEYYSVGGDDDFAPDESGFRLIKLKSKATLTKTSKFGMFLTKLVVAGYPINRMDPASIEYLVGTKAHFLREALETKGIAKAKDEREKTVLLPSKVISLPGEGAATGAKAKAKGKAATAAANTELADGVANAILDELANAGGEMPKRDLVSALFKSAAIEALGKKDAVKLVGDDTFLKGRSEWTFENGVLTIA